MARPWMKWLAGCLLIGLAPVVRANFEEPATDTPASPTAAFCSECGAPCGCEPCDSGT